MVIDHHAISNTHPFHILHILISVSSHPLIQPKYKSLKMSKIKKKVV